MLPAASTTLKWPRITIVTPSYNQGKFIEETLRSVLLQGYPNLEYIIMDGGSTDGTVGIIKKYSSFFDYWVSEKDKGQGDAVYRGFERATGEVLGWLNSDDILLPGTLHKVGEYFLRRPDVELVHGGCVQIDGETRVILDRRGLPECHLGARQSYARMLLRGCYGISQPACFWRRVPFFEMGGYDRDLSNIFDLDMLLRFVKRRPFGRIPEFLACFRVHPDAKCSLPNSPAWKADSRLFDSRHYLSVPRWLRYVMDRAFAAEVRWGRRALKLRLLLGLVRVPPALRDFKSPAKR
jgi:glycosyltransferase involved in cell wall biosynthesis